MKYFPPTIILRHRRENLKKCSLRGLESRQDMLFYSYPLKQQLPDLTGYVVLALNAPPLTLEDADKGIFLIDGTWRYAEKMLHTLYRKNLKNREFGKKAAQILESGASDIVLEQGASEDPKFVAKPTSPKTDSSGFFGIKLPFELRSLPASAKTAYPRRQEDARGLASCEALYLAYEILGRDPSGLLDHYQWKEKFLKR